MRFLPILVLLVVAALTSPAIADETRPSAADAAPDDADSALDDEGLDELLEGEDVAEPSRTDGDESAASADATRDALRTWKGFVEVEVRSYLRDRDQGRSDDQLILRAELELDFDFGNGVTALFRPRVLVDALDGDLKRFEPFEAYVTWTAESWDLRVGQFVENWGIVDTFNPIDVVNRRDLATDFLDPERLGELGVRFRVFGDGNETIGEPTLSLYLLPVFRPTEFPTEDGRFSFGTAALPFDEDSGFEPDGGDRGLYALRFQATLSTRPFNADLQALVARGPERTPTFLVLADRTVPVYYGAWTWGLGLRAVPNADVLGEQLAKLTLKAEAVFKDPFRFRGSPVPALDDYLTYVLGVDRIFDGVFKDQDQITATLEYAREVGASGPAARFRPFRNDLILRLLWEANDFARTSFELRVLVDVDESERIVEVVFERQLRKLHEDLKIVARVQFFDSPGDGSTLFDFFPDNTSASVTLRWDF